MITKVLPLIGGTLAVTKSWVDTSNKDKQRKKEMQESLNEDIQYENKIKGMKAKQEYEREQESKKHEKSESLSKEAKEMKKAGATKKLKNIKKEI